MDAEDIRRYVELSSTLKTGFRGVYPNYAYPVELSCGSYIINSQGGLPGGHWLAVHKSRSEDLLLFFDSYGKSPREWDMEFEGYQVLYNDRCVQPAGSKLCALYCLYFILLKNKQLTMADIVQSFHVDKQDNDIMMISFAARLAAGHL